MVVNLNTVIVEGVYSALPAFGMAGRIYFATDTGRVWYDTGTAWVDVTPQKPTLVAVTVPALGGNFTVEHGLPAAPSSVSLEPTSGGAIWFVPGSGHAAGYDATYLYLAGSDPGITCNAQCRI